MSQPETSLEGIEAAAAEAMQMAEAATPEERIVSLEARLASIEPLLEQLQAQSELGVKIQKYVSSLQAEQSFFNVARWILGAIWVVIVIFFGWLLWDAVYSPKSPLLTAPPLAIATFVIGMVSGIVLLLSSFVRGVFRTTAERHAEGFLPPTLDAALEAYQKLIGKHGS
jgi:MFS superfamily sulfate permease-like transporter